MRVRSLTLVVAMFTRVGAFAVDVIPDGWISPEQLARAEDPIQRQLDTGIAMGPTAWDMAAVKDARLVLIYLTLYQRLPDEVSREKLLSEQQAWLRQRRKIVDALADPDGGSIVVLEQAEKHMNLTEKRIVELQKRVDHLQKVESGSSTNAPSPAKPPLKGKRRQPAEAEH